MPFVEYLVKQSTVLDWLQLGLAQCVSVPKTYDPFELSLYFWLSSDQIMHIHIVRIILVLNVIILFFGGGAKGDENSGGDDGDDETQMRAHVRAHI